MDAVGSSLALTALLMGLVGGPHCVAMCGAACAALGQAAQTHAWRATLTFQLGRILGYAALGALAAASMQGLGWLTVQSAAVRPLWSLAHVAATVLGLLLLVQARQPAWMEQLGTGVWRRLRAQVQAHGTLGPLLVGMLWALMPCGLLYSALLVAALSGSVAGGAVAMALFALGSSVLLTLGPLLWLRLARNGAQAGRWGIRLAGAALTASSAWALWHGLVHNSAPWCIS